MYACYDRPLQCQCDWCHHDRTPYISENSTRPMYSTGRVFLRRQYQSGSFNPANYFKTARIMLGPPPQLTRDVP